MRLKRSSKTLTSWKAQLLEPMKLEEMMRLTKKLRNSLESTRDLLKCRVNSRVPSHGSQTLMTAKRELKKDSQEILPLTKLRRT
jgi:hypothetical protein